MQDIVLNKLIKFLEFELNDYMLELDNQIRVFPQKADQSKQDINEFYDLNDYLLELGNQTRLFTQKAKQTKQHKKEFIERNKNLREILNEGHCFGFSLVHAAMDYMGKLDWWEQVLINIANWDEQSGSLNSTLKLPGTAEETTLKNIMSRALNYIVTSHAINDHSFPDLNQKNILQPDGYNAVNPVLRKNANPPQIIQRSYFEILDENSSEVKTIKQREIIAGCFTREQLMGLLTDDLSEHAIILVHNHNHTIRIARTGKQWMIYDPNYHHNAVPIHKRLSKFDCINEMFSTLKTSSIAIQAASFNEHELIHFPGYTHLLKTSSLSLLHDHGLHRMAQYSPTALLELIKHVDESMEGRAVLKAIAQAMTEKDSEGWTALHFMARFSPTALVELMKHIDDSMEGRAVLKAIAQAMTEKDCDDWTALHLMAQYSPEALCDLMKHVDESVEGRAVLKAIAQAMTEKDSEGSTTLHIIAQYSPEALCDLMKHVDESMEGRAVLKAIAQAMTEKDSEGWTVLRVMVHYSPEALFNLVKRVNNSTEGNALLTVIAQMMIEKDANGLNMLHIMERDSSRVLVYLLTGIDKSLGKKAISSEIPILLLLNTPNGLDSFLKILSAKTMNNKTTWQYICKNAPHTKRQIIDCICTHLEKMKNAELALYEKEIDRALSDKNALYRGICKTHTLFYGRYVKTDLYLKMKDTIQKTREKNMQEEKMDLIATQTIRVN